MDTSSKSSNFSLSRDLVFFDREYLNNRYTIRYENISFVVLLYLNFLQNQESAVLMYDLALTYILRSSLMVSRSGSSPTRTITTR